LRLASRIGHAAGMCEAMEDLARIESVERPAFAHMLLRAARAERESRDLPLRRRDAEELTTLEAALASTAGEQLADRPFTSLVAELAG
jgi:predicted RNA-binding Zn ribbon-like protein